MTYKQKETPTFEKAETGIPFAPAYGESTDAVLEEVGLSSSDIAALRSEGVVA